MSHLTRCRHFKSMMEGDSCHKGIAYRTVMQQGGLAPCHEPDLQHLCASYEPPTEEQLKEYAEVMKHAGEYLTKMLAFERRETEVCPVCGQHVNHLEKVGRCTYARPCNCRIWQGDVPVAWRINGQNS